MDMKQIMEYARIMVETGSVWRLSPSAVSVLQAQFLEGAKDLSGCDMAIQDLRTEVRRKLVLFGRLARAFAVARESIAIEGQDMQAAIELGNILTGPTSICGVTT